MSANPLELYSVYGRLGNAETLAPPGPERRHRARVRLHWPLVLFRRQDAEAVESVTDNLNSGGFYCQVPVAFGVGEPLTCAMKVPTHDPKGRLSERNLECQVRVVRVKPEADGRYGLACRIEDYHFAQAIAQT